MIIVGIAGGVGSGKTTVANVFQRKGAEVLEADKLAHTFLDKGSDQYRDLVAAFGSGILDENGRIDRKALGKEAFASRESVKRLNDIVHPRLVGEIKEAVNTAKAKGAGVFVVDAALLFDWNIESLFDVTIDVESQSGVERASRRMSVSEEDVRKRTSAQMTPEERRSRADVVIENDTTIEELERKSEELWQTIVGRK